MTIQQFIEKAVEGGWKPSNPHLAKVDAAWIAAHYSMGNAEMFLDPEAWKAVGKVEGWETSGWKRTAMAELFEFAWLYNMHRMLDVLAEGRSVKQYLETL